MFSRELFLYAVYALRCLHSHVCLYILSRKVRTLLEGVVELLSKMLGDCMGDTS